MIACDACGRAFHRDCVAISAAAPVRGWRGDPCGMNAGRRGTSIVANRRCPSCASGVVVAPGAPTPAALPLAPATAAPAPLPAVPPPAPPAAAPPPPPPPPPEEPEATERAGDDPLGLDRFLTGAAEPAAADRPSPALPPPPPPASSPEDASENAPPPPPASSPEDAPAPMSSPEDAPAPMSSPEDAPPPPRRHPRPLAASNGLRAKRVLGQRPAKRPRSSAATAPPEDDDDAIIDLCSSQSDA